LILSARLISKLVFPIAGLAATSLGAEILEFHAVFSKEMFGPDAKASVEINDIIKLVSGVKEIRSSLQTSNDKLSNDKFKEVKKIFEKSLCVNKALQKGHIISFDDLEAKKPSGFGLDAKFFREVIGKKIVKNVEQWTFLTADVIESFG
jgi:N-acetylneuraminate synthase